MQTFNTRASQRTSKLYEAEGIVNKKHVTVVDDAVGVSSEITRAQGEHRTGDLQRLVAAQPTVTTTTMMSFDYYYFFLKKKNWIDR